MILEFYQVYKTRSEIYNNNGTSRFTHYCSLIEQQKLFVENESREITLGGKFKSIKIWSKRKSNIRIVPQSIKCKDFSYRLASLYSFNNKFLHKIREYT